MELAAGLANVPRWPERSWREALTAPHVALVATDGKELHAVAVATFAADLAELETIAVATGSRRRGLARQLIAALGTELCRAAVTELWLEVRISNTPAITLYLALGFEETGRRANYYSDPIEDAMLMRLLLC